MSKRLGERLRELRRVVRLHTQWLLASLLGADVLDEAELDDIAKLTRLPLPRGYDLVKRSYVLGRAKATTRSAEFHNISDAKLEDMAAKAGFTSLEDFALEHARHAAVSRVQRVVDRIASSITDKLSAHVHRSVAAESTKGSGDPAELQDASTRATAAFAETVAQEARAAWAKEWSNTAHAELHIAKQTGAVQAIINKIDVYRNGDGADSLVSVVPGAGNCEDCASHFIGADGNPKVFKLQQLFEQGSNADAGVKHSRQNGLHVHWKTTMPPLHPGCGCHVMYIPKGMGWVDGKLTVRNEQVFVEELRKAVDTGSMSATIKPPGPKTATPAAPAVKASQNPGSIKGAAAPGNVAGPGRPPASPAQPAAGGAAPNATASFNPMPEDDSEPCPFGGGDECIKHDGNGAENHKKGGVISQRHSQYTETGASEFSEADPSIVASSIAWNKQDNAKAVVMQHLSVGKFAHVTSTRKPIEEEASGSSIDPGVTESFVVQIEGNGRGMMKPTVDFSELRAQYSTGGAMSGDLTNGPSNASHAHEAAAHSLYSLFGADGTVPPTATREHAGTMVSVQQFKEGYETLKKARITAGIHNKGFESLVAKAPKEHQDAFRKKLETIAFLDLASNQGDGHFGNLMVNEDFTDVIRIDNSNAFGNSMFGVKNQMFKLMAHGKQRVAIPSHVKEKLETTSLGDLKRALGDHLPDWQIGQQYMRQKYLVHLDNTDGGIDPEKFIGVQGAVFVEKEVASLRTSKFTSDAEKVNFRGRKDRGELPHNLFESFAKDWIDTAAADESHPDHATATELKNVGIFMPHSSMSAPAAARKDGAHKRYEATINANSDVPKTLFDLKATGMVLGTPAAKKAAGSSGSSGDPKSSGKKEAESPAAEPPTVAAVADEDGTQAAKPADLAKLLKKGINLFLDLTKQ